MPAREARPGDRVLVTGATGFLGGHLTAHLAGAGYRVRALARETSDTRRLKQLGAEVARGDVRAPETVRAAAQGCRYIIHAAGLFRLWGAAQDFEQINVQGTAHVAAAAQDAGVERLVHVSTVAVVGRPPPGQPIDEATPCQPADDYQRSKLEGERLAWAASAAGGLEVVILRPGAYYGPGGRYAFNRLFVEDPLKGLLIQVHGGRRITFPAFAPDVAQACTLALASGAAGETYNICGEPLTHRAVNAAVSAAAGLPRLRVNVPAGLMLALARWQTRRAERTGREPYYPVNLALYVFQDWRVCSDKARRDLGFSPTPFAVGARATVEWYWQEGIFRRRNVRG
jgi:dihydroflavonol-4-reductase